MKKKLSYRATEAQLLTVVEGLRQAKLRSEIMQDIITKYGVSKKRAKDIYAEGLKYIDTVTVANAQEYKSILLDRLEAQYKDTFLIEDISRRIQRQKELVDSMAKISGVLQNTVNMINIFEYYPDADTGKTINVNSSYPPAIEQNEKGISHTIQNLIEDNMLYEGYEYDKKTNQ